MKNQEILNQEEQDQQMPGIIQTFTSVYNGASKQISYQQVYNSVYKLCKKGYADQIINQLNIKSTAHFNKILKGLEEQNTKISYILTSISEVRQSIDRISQILLYIDSNYMNDSKREHHTIKQTLNYYFFKAFYENKTILFRIAKQIAQARIKGTQHQILPLIQIINTLDQKEVFFPQFLFDIYLKTVTQHFKKAFLIKYSEQSFKQFLISTRKKLQQERQWIQKYFTRVKGKKVTQQLMRKIFQEQINELKQKIYKEHSQQLFKTQILEFLQLLNEKKQEKQLNTFNDWYINELKKRLSVVDRKNNLNFLKEFIKQYKQISKYLENTKEFNIALKVAFFFQNWINQDRNHFPRRLNIFCQEIVLKSQNIKADMQDFVLLFKFLKQKTYFQKQFRRICVLRMIYDSNKSHTDIQNQMIKQMGKQCSQEWIQRLNSLQKSTEQSKILQNQKINLLVIQDSAWPFQMIKTQAVIPNQLLSILGNYKKLYEQKFQGRVLQLNPFQGYTILKIKFNKSNPQFKLNTLMTTILLNLQALRFKSIIKNVLQVTNLTINQVIEQLKVLEKQKIIILHKSSKSQDFPDSEIQLNLQYQPKMQGKLIDLTQRYIQEQFTQSNDYQQLKSQKKMMVEAFIVKIMKSNKTISNNQLEEQLTPMIEARGYKFNKDFVINAFNGLIDKRYIKQLQDGTYTYLAS